MAGLDGVLDRGTHGIGHGGEAEEHDLPLAARRGRFGLEDVAEGEAEDAKTPRSEGVHFVLDSGPMDFVEGNDISLIENPGAPFENLERGAFDEEPPARTAFELGGNAHPLAHGVEG